MRIYHIAVCTYMDLLLTSERTKYCTEYARKPTGAIRPSSHNFLNYWEYLHFTPHRAEIPINNLFGTPQVVCQFANVGTPLARWQSDTYSQAFDVTVICLHLVRADIALAALIALKVSVGIHHTHTYGWELAVHGACRCYLDLYR